MFRRVAVLAVLAPALALATPTRTTSLGDMNLYLDDDSSVFLFPGQTARWANLFELDLGGVPGQQLGGLQQTAGGGAFLHVGKSLVLGAWATDYTSPTMNTFLKTVDAFATAANAGKFSTLGALGGNPGAGASERKYDVFAGYALSEATSVGLQLSYGSDTEHTIPGPNSAGAGKDRLDDYYGQTDLRVGAGLSSGTADEGYDAAVSYQYSGVSYLVDGYSHFTGGSGSTLGLTARYRAKLNERWTLIPALNYSVDVFGLTEDTKLAAFGGKKGDPLDHNEDRKHSMLDHTVDAGVASRFKANERVSLWAALGAAINYVGASATILTDDTASGLNNVVLGASTMTWGPYLRIGLEAQLNDWLVFRGGVRKEALTLTTNTSRDDPKSTQTTNSTSRSDVGLDEGTPSFVGFVGLGVKYGGLVADLLLDPGIFFRGPNFISGAGGPLATRVTLAYAF